MKYLEPSFSVTVGSKAYRDQYEKMDWHDDKKDAKVRPKVTGSISISGYTIEVTEASEASQYLYLARAKSEKGKHTFYSGRSFEELVIRVRKALANGK